MAVKAWEVVGTIGLSGLGKSVGKLETFDAAGASAASTLAKVRNVAGLAAGGITAAGAMAGGKAVSDFARFDEAMTTSTAIMDDLTRTLEEDMVFAAQEVARQTTFSAREAAKGYFFLASAGLDAKESLQALPEVAEFAAAGQFDLARATELVTDAQSAMGLKTEDTAQNLRNLKRVQDVLVNANQQANATVEQFSESLTNRAAAAARSFDKSIEETTATLAVFADQGRKGRRAGTQLARFLRITAEGAAENREQFQNMGLVDAQGNLESMAEIVEGLTNHLRGMSDAAKTAELKQLGFTARVQAAIKPLLGMSDQIREYQKNLEAAGGSSETVAEKQLDTLSRQLDLLGSELKTSSIRLGEFISEGSDLPEAASFWANAIETVREEVQGWNEDVAQAFDPDTAEEIRKRLKQAFEAQDPRGPTLKRARKMESVISGWGAAIPEDEMDNFRQIVFDIIEAVREGKIDHEEINSAISERTRQLARNAATWEDIQESLQIGGRDMSDIDRVVEQKAKTAQKMNELLQQEQNRRIEDQLGLTSRLIEKQKERLRTLIREEASLEDQRQAAKRLVELLERRDEGPVVSPGVAPDPGAIGGTPFGEGALLETDLAGSIPASQMIGPEDMIDEGAFASGGQRSRNLIQRSTTSIVDEAMSGVEQAAPMAARRLGRQLITGIASGSFDAKEFLMNALTTVVQAALFGGTGGLGGIVGALGIFSPARATMPIGEALVEGMAVKIESKTSRMESAMKTAVMPALGVAQRFAGQVGRTTSGRLRSRISGISAAAAAAGGGAAIGGRPLVVIDPDELDPMTSARMARDPAVGRARTAERDLFKKTGAGRT